MFLALIASAVLVYMTTRIGYNSTEKEDFYRSPTFIGKRSGYVFSTRERGTGYYRDKVITGTV